MAFFTMFSRSVVNFTASPRGPFNLEELPSRARNMPSFLKLTSHHQNICVFTKPMCWSPELYGDSVRMWGFDGAWVESSWMGLENTFVRETLILFEAGENHRWMPMNLEGVIQRPRGRTSRVTASANRLILDFTAFSMLRNKLQSLVCYPVCRALS